MGWFKNAFNFVKAKVKKHANFHDLKEKAKKGWNIGTMLLGKARSFSGKAKKVARIAALIPGLQEYTLPILAGIETVDAALGTIDRYRKKAENLYSVASKRRRNFGTRKKIDPRIQNIFNKLGTTPGIMPIIKKSYKYDDKRAASHYGIFA